MEFIIGSSIVAAALLFLSFVILKNGRRKKIKKNLVTQSTIFEIIAPALPILKSLYKEPLNSQASKYADRNKVNVLVLENKAYWIKDNNVFVAKIINNDIDQDSAQVVDTMTMNKVQLKELSYIVEKLTEGKINDPGNPRYPKF